MAPQLYDPSTEVTLDPTRARCSCRKSVVLPGMPVIHCPKCHDSYTARRLTYPVFCAKCGFNLKNWRLRNGIPELTDFVK